jgi:alpha-mannosidase
VPVHDAVPVDGFGREAQPAEAIGVADGRARIPLRPWQIAAVRVEVAALLGS